LDEGVGEEANVADIPINEKSRSPLRNGFFVGAHPVSLRHICSLIGRRIYYISLPMTGLAEKKVHFWETAEEMVNVGHLLDILT
jgi:hypothetical protein